MYQKVALVLAALCLLGVAPAATPDPYLWLEEVHGARALSWVKAQDARTLSVLERDPHYHALYGQALQIAENKDRLATPRFLGEDVYNFWRDAQHVRGIWRRTSLSDYLKSTPSWRTVLDLDRIAADDRANWVWEGARCRRSDERRCLIVLSDGGEDAQTLREFDVATGVFVPGGFMLPRGKQNTAWEDDETLLVAREWSPGELTASGYPYVVKRLRRGQPLSSAVEVFRGSKDDVEVDPVVLHDGAGNRAVLIDRATSFFSHEYDLQTSSGLRKLALPPKTEIQALVAGRLVVKVNEDWNDGEKRIKAGSVASLDLAAASTDPDRLIATIVYEPGPRESVDEVAATRSRLVIVNYENVKGRAYLLTPGAAGGWSRRRVDLPDNSSIGVVSSDEHREDLFLGVSGFLTRSTLWLSDGATASVRQVKRLRPMFDASNETVDQLEATSKDGTRIPYFVVHPRTMRRDGSNPTILTAYGGFQFSMTPTYDPMNGRLWLERGGVFVLANIRGGGEFGPAWHEAGLTTQRQRIYDDFAAVGEDLIARKITSPRRLGIEGGSNGGLLMGVEMEQHPNLWNAVNIGVPLLDMLRYEQIAAGASWVAEYGSVSVPEQRAFLASISPYNNLKAGVRYPEPLIWTTTKDDRVGPQHARKFAAKMAALHQPYLFYEVVEGGHGSGANLRERAQTEALQMTYFARKLMD